MPNQTERGGWTPGPWFADALDCVFTEPDGNGLLIANARNSAIPKDCRPGNNEQEANAHLIAAAPMLLEALEQFLSEHIDLVESGDCGFWDPEKEEKVIKARAAIAIAKGEGQ